MNIKLNKDFEQEYPDDVWKGFTGRQTATIIIAVVLGGATIFGIWYLTRIEPKYCVYLGMPVLAAILFFGFKQYQGMFVEQYLKELLFERKIRHLSFDAGELEEKNVRIFSMDTKKKEGRKKHGNKWK